MQYQILSVWNPYPVVTVETNRIITGDSLHVLGELDADSVHAIVTDPPYGLAFMGRSWDDFEPREYQAWCMEWAEKAKRVLKPGGHLLAFSGNRTHHRLFTGVEDAGYELRDTLTWHYGSGFPKALDVSKAIDKNADADRDVVGKYHNPDGSTRDYDNSTRNSEDTFNQEQCGFKETNEGRQITSPATDAAEQWDGWKTCLKPATEFIVLARKQFGDGTVAENVQEHGTGALNIGACRIGGDVDTLRAESGGIGDGVKYRPGVDADLDTGSKTGGRFPANVLFDESQAARLDSQTGTLESGGVDFSKHTDRDTQEKYGEFSGGSDRTESFPADSGGASRFFYCSKATKAERTLDGRIENSHPTVKPVDLMEWLVKLVTAEEQVVLDPFAGSGTTCRAAKNLNRRFVGVEQQEKWADVARVRCGLSPVNPGHVRAEDSPERGLEAFTD